MRVLFLTPWYPSEKDVMLGLFVQKHVEAVRAQGCEVRVIFSQTWRDMFAQWRALRREGWMPDVVQLNVIQKQGLLALWLKKRYGIPFVIVEHWSGYLPENGQYTRQPAIKRRFAERVAEQASAILPVSNALAKAMQDCGIRNSRWLKIYNVVDDFFFEGVESQKSKAESRKTLLHVSCFDEKAKNVKGLLRAAKMLSEKRQDWQLVLVGTGIDYKDVRAYAESLSFPEGILRWTGELTPREVAEEMSHADAFVLNSNYENAPVVLSESMASGIPVIATRAGGMPEMIADECGILVPPRNDRALTEAMEHMLDHHSEYDRAAIRQAGKKYSYEAVGKQLKEIYEEVRRL
ncbi:MAG: glycosyltransferase family 4 protein [Paludibacteraceae bacterium]|nr:glycosyltransferase family 4 protein [Paludibacteraceae bacterium]